MLLRTTASARRPSLTMAAVCTALLVLAGLLRGVVVCSTHDGDSHLAFAHAEGTCCHHDHGADAHVLLQHDGDELPRDAQRSDGICEHLELGIPLAPGPQPDAHELPDDAPPVATLPLDLDATTRCASATRRPPATGPPRPSSLLRQRRTVVLLI